jgi:hypothetical protein
MTFFTFIAGCLQISPCSGGTRHDAAAFFV